MGGQQTSRTKEQPVLGDAEDVRAAAEALADGCPVVHGFGNLYAVTARADRAAVERVNRMKGRPPAQAGSVTTVRGRVASLFDWSRLPERMPRRQIEELVEELFLLGPFGFRGPAAAHLPPHLTSVQDGVSTVQLIGPGYRCPSNAFLAEALDRTAGTFLSITSVNRSRHLTGADHEPAHWRAEAPPPTSGTRTTSASSPTTTRPRPACATPTTRRSRPRCSPSTTAPATAARACPRSPWSGTVPFRRTTPARWPRTTASPSPSPRTPPTASSPAPTATDPRAGPADRVAAPRRPGQGSSEFAPDSY